jgi:hypothetical protein
MKLYFGNDPELKSFYNAGYDIAWYAPRYNSWVMIPKPEHDKDESRVSNPDYIFLMYDKDFDDIASVTLRNGIVIKRNLTCTN